MAGTTKLSLLLSAASVVYVDSLYNPFKRTRQKLSHPIFFASNSEIVGDAAQSTITNGHYRKYHSVEFRAEFLHRVLSRRGGESVDENDIAADEGEIPMSHFISSFESELAEIRREVELEAREEMQKLRGMLEWSENKYHGEEVAEEEDMMEAYKDRKNENGLHEQRFVGEEDELVDEVRSDDSGVFNDGVKISEEELQVNDEEYGKEEKEQKEEIDRESSDLENYAENTEYPRKENRTKEIQEIAGGEGGSEIIELDNINETVSYLPEEQEEEISAVIEEVTEQVDNEIIPTRSTILEEGITEIEDEIEREQPIDAANKTITAADPKPKLRKKAKSSKKGKVGKMTNQEEDTVPTTKNPKAKMRKAKAKENMSEKVIDFESIHAFDEFSSKPAIHKMGTQQSVEVTFTPEDEELERSRSRGVTRLIRSELARALTLFIATIVVSIWMQRLQRQLEAQGN